MSKDRELQERRRREVLEILAQDEKIKEQRELVEKLHARGIPATQSNISRDLKALGAVRTKGHYEIPSWQDEEEGVSPFRRAVPFIQEVRPAGPYQLLLVTDPGAGRMVAQAISDAKWDDIVGTVDGDSSVLVLSENSFFQKLAYERIKYFMTDGGEYEVVELE
jgi:transcriptional regulator of arginine metabolism